MGQLKPCPVCETIYFHMEYVEKHPFENTYEKYNAALVIDSYRKADNVRCGRTTYKPYALRYCPRCGRRIKLNRRPTND